MSDDEERDVPNAADEADATPPDGDASTVDSSDAGSAEESAASAATEADAPDAAADEPTAFAEPEDPDAVEGDPFEEMDVDTDAVDGQDVLDAAATQEAAERDAVPVDEPAEDDDVRVISDRTCHNCEFFADPPDLACNHEGTEIRRVVDTEHYEVVNCPMVLDDVDITDDL